MGACGATLRLEQSRPTRRGPTISREDAAWRNLLDQTRSNEESSAFTQPVEKLRKTIDHLEREASSADVGNNTVSFPNQDERN